MMHELFYDSGSAIECNFAIIALAIRKMNKKREKRRKL